MVDKKLEVDYDQQLKTCGKVHAHQMICFYFSIQQFSELWNLTNLQLNDQELKMKTCGQAHRQMGFLFNSVVQ